MDGFLSFGEKMLIQRTRKGLTRIQLADMVGVSPTTLYNYEEGKSQPKQIETLIKLCNILEIPINEAVHFFQDSAPMEREFEELIKYIIMYDRVDFDLPDGVVMFEDPGKIWRNEDLECDLNAEKGEACV